MTVRTRRGDESGLVAVVVAISAVLIFSLCALSVDIGNAYARKRDIQTQADLAALAAGAYLPNNSASNAAILAALDKYAELNLVNGQDETQWNFTDADKTNGYVEFLGPDEIRVIAPEAYVDFGMASVLGVAGTDVTATAAVRIKSPGDGGVPFYAVTGCDYGLQTISDDQTSSPPSGTPTLADSSDPSDSTVTSIATSPATSPPQLPQGSSGASLFVNGTGFSGTQSGQPIVVKRVGFFRDLSKTPNVETTTAFTVNSPTSISVTVPSTVTAVADQWYVRVEVNSKQSGQTKDRWTAAPGPALTIAGPTPTPTAGWSECATGSQSGNFGTLDLPRQNDDGKWIEMNILAYLDPKLSITAYPSNQLVPAECAKTDPPPTVTSTSKHDINLDTNCVNTKPGFPGSEVTTGFIEGLGSYDGRLDKDTSANPAPSISAGCAPDGSTSRVNTGIKKRGNGAEVHINNDLLSCFLLNDTTTVGDVAQPPATFPASAKHTLSSKIFDSPRFMWVPLFSAQPSDGLKYYKVVGWRPAFLTDQPTTATRQNRHVGTSTVNGLKYSSNGKSIKSIKVLFINGDALPDTVASRGPSFDYTGTGTKALTLVE